MYIIGGSGGANVVRHGPLRVWAENGFVCIEDSRVLSGKEGSFSQLHWRDAAVRIKALNDMLGKKTDGTYVHADAWNREMKFVEAMLPVIQQAKEQGAYDDPSMVRARTRSLSTQVSMASYASELPL